MDYLPLFHNLKGQLCVVVGGGEVALRKIRLLLEAGARVKAIAIEFTPALQTMAQNSRLILVPRKFRRFDLRGAVLVVAATHSRDINSFVYRMAVRRRIPVNVVDNPDLCTVIFPAIVDRSPIQIAIGTGGSAPVMARLLRGKVESLLPSNYGQLARLAQKLRDTVKSKLPAGNARRAYWESILQGRVAELIFSGKTTQAEQLALQQLDQADKQSIGEVYLVGGGPGDPDLLTFRALRLMEQADIVLYDRLVSKEVLNLVRRDAERIYVGKTAGDHPVTQDNINQKLVDYARQGKRVLRLKGGDPFIFGRGGEEITHLAGHSIPFQVVPGITAASGCASYAGIPLTHRDYAQSVRFIAGHRKDSKLDLDWEDLAKPGQTLVFYMGLNGLETICAELQTHGMPADTPAALIEKGTSLRQRVFVADLSSLPEKVRQAEAKAPTLIIVGGVVKLHDTLSWFGSQ